MTPRRWPAAALVVLVCFGAAADAVAQAPIESLRLRRAQAAPSTEAMDPAVVELERGDAPGGTFTPPPGTRVERDLAYGPEPAHKLDVYIPEGAKSAPILVMVHGGAWMFGDKGHAGVVANKAKHWLPRGYIVVSQNYRMGRPPDPLGQAEDVGRALAYVQGNAASWGGDGSRVVLMGHSSGAHLVALLSAAPAGRGPVGRPALARDDRARQRRAGPGRADERPSSALHDRVFGADAGRWAEMSPVHRLAAAPVPMLLVCASRRSDSCAAARRFAAKAQALGGRATALPVDLGHGQINTELGQSPSYTASVDAFLRSLGLP